MTNATAFSAPAAVSVPLRSFIPALCGGHPHGKVISSARSLQSPAPKDLKPFFSSTAYSYIRRAIIERRYAPTGSLCRSAFAHRLNRFVQSAIRIELNSAGERRIAVGEEAAK